MTCGNAATRPHVDGVGCDDGASLCVGDDDLVVVFVVGDTMPRATHMHACGGVVLVPLAGVRRYQ